jgi:energy-coupling factor transporter transmembrane protein EcfT
MKVLYTICRILYWLLIFVPSVAFALLLMLVGVGGFLNGYMRYSHITPHKHPHLVDIPVDFSKPGVFKADFNYGPSRSGDRRLIVLINAPKSAKPITDYDFPLKANILFKLKNPESAKFDEYNDMSIKSLRNNCSLIDKYTYFKEGQYQLEITVKKGNSDLQGYSQKLIFNDEYCLGGMNKVKESLIFGIKWFTISIIIILLNTLYILRSKRKRACTTDILPEKQSA